MNVRPSILAPGALLAAGLVLVAARARERPSSAEPSFAPRVLAALHGSSEAFALRFEGLRPAVAGEVLPVDLVLASGSTEVERVIARVELPPGVRLESRDVVARGPAGDTLIETGPRARISGAIELDLRDRLGAGEERRYELLLSFEPWARGSGSISARAARLGPDGRVDRLTVVDAYQFFERDADVFEPRTVEQLVARQRAQQAGGGEEGYGLDGAPRPDAPVATSNVRTVLDVRAASADPFEALHVPAGRPFHDVPDPR